MCVYIYKYIYALCNYLLYVCMYIHTYMHIYIHICLLCLSIHTFRSKYHLKCKPNVTIIIHLKQLISKVSLLGSLIQIPGPQFVALSRVRSIGAGPLITIFYPGSSLYSLLAAMYIINLLIFPPHAFLAVMDWNPQKSRCKWTLPPSVELSVILP